MRKVECNKAKVTRTEEKIKVPQLVLFPWHVFQYFGNN